MVVRLSSAMEGVRLFPIDLVLQYYLVAAYLVLLGDHLLPRYAGGVALADGRLVV